MEASTMIVQQQGHVIDINGRMVQVQSGDHVVKTERYRIRSQDSLEQHIKHGFDEDIGRRE